jgi:phosphoribosylanthranilate isomerase
VSATWIKICGLSSPEAVSAALSAGADAIGFVFAESVRRTTPERALQLAAPARGRAKCVAVTRHPTQSAIDEILRVFQPDLLQTDAEDLARLRLPQLLELLPVLRTRGVVQGTLPPRVLFEGSVSGSGATVDWNEARALAQQTQVVLAGGLTPENVGQAIAAAMPYGVDVSSGVEEQPGVKSIAKIAAFVAAARATAQEQIS